MVHGLVKKVEFSYCNWFWRKIPCAVLWTLQKEMKDMEVVFRLLMFRPFKGEILSGTVETSDEKGVRVSLGFFNDVYVPRHLLQQPCKRGDDGLWIWEHECGELPLDLDEEIIFQVNNVKYPAIPVTQDEKAKPFAPMEIIGDIHGDGLGLVAWWR